MKTVMVPFLLIVAAVVALVLYTRQRAVAQPLSERGRVTDQPLYDPMDTGAGWYDYWAPVLRDTFKSLGVMPPQGPDPSWPGTIMCIKEPCPIRMGTPTPEAP